MKKLSKTQAQNIAVLARTLSDQCDAYVENSATMSDEDGVEATASIRRSFLSVSNSGKALRNSKK